MKKLSAILAVYALLAVCPLQGQTVRDCSNCSQADWHAEWNPALGTCVYNSSLGCGQGCNCHVGFYEGYGLSTKPDFFGGAFMRDAKGVVQGFRIDRPGPLANNRVKSGDVAIAINGQRPRLSHLGTKKRPIRRAEATWDDQGRLSLRVWR